MAEQELSLLIRLRDEASAQLRQIGATLQANEREWRSAGIAAGAFGAAIMAGIGLAYRASEENRIELARLSNTLKNIGVDYDNVADSIERYVSQTQKATGIGDSEQVAALNQLITITGNYDRAMQLLPITLDLARAKQMDVMTSAILLGQVAEGNINALNRYGFSMDGVKTAGEALELIQQRVAGSAQAMVSPFALLRTSVAELAEGIGGLVAGPLEMLIKQATNIITSIREWIDQNPELARTIIELVLAIGSGATAFASIALGVMAFVGALKILGGPLAATMGGIAALVALATILTLHWNEVKTILGNIWDYLAEKWDMVWAAIQLVAFAAMGPIGVLITWLIQSVVHIIEAWDTTKPFFTNLWNSIKIIFRDAINDIIGMINFLTAPLAGLFGFEGISKLSATAFGITYPEGGYQPHQLPGMTGRIPNEGGYPAHGYVPPSGGPLSLVDIYGNYGRLGQTGVLPGGITITINNAGSVISDQDLAEQIRQALIQLQLRNATTGID